MPHPVIPSDEIARRGKLLYERDIRSKVETPENIGKQLVIDVETGDFVIDDEGLAASRRLLASHPGAALYGVRIGYDAVISFGGVSSVGPRLIPSELQSALNDIAVV